MTFLSILLLSLYLFSCITPKIRANPEIIHVPQDYPEINEAVEAANEGDTILVAPGIYRESNIISIFKNDISIIGENPDNTIIELPSELPDYPDVFYISGSGITISGFTIQRKPSTLDHMIYGIHLWYAKNCVIKGNKIRGNGYGIVLHGTQNILVEGNYIENNDVAFLLEFAPDSSGNIIHNNTVQSNNYVVTFDTNPQGGSSENFIYHNNFKKYTSVVWRNLGPELTIRWDDGYPSGGNYWDDYVGVDEKSGSNQDQPGRDGIGDSPYIIDENNRDRYPLMEPYNAPITPSQETHISLKDFRYEDLLPSTFESLVETLGAGNIAVKGKFHATLNPPELIRKAEVVIVAEYVIIGEKGVVKEETKSFELKPVDSEFIADINLETVWPAKIVDWFVAIAAWKILGDPSYLIQNIGQDAFLPEYIVYVGFEKIYIRANVIKVIGFDTSGKSFEIPLDVPLPLKTSYKSLAEWAEREDYGWVMSFSPIALSVVDKDGHRVGAYKGQVVGKSGNMYYIGEAGKPQFIVVKTPSIDSTYYVEIEGIDQGNYTLIAGQRVAGKIDSITLANGKQILQGDLKTYNLKFTSTGIIEDVPPWWVQRQLWIISGAIAAIALVSITIVLVKRKKKFKSPTNSFP